MFKENELLWLSYSERHVLSLSLPLSQFFFRLKKTHPYSVFAPHSTSKEDIKSAMYNFFFFFLVHLKWNMFFLMLMGTLYLIFLRLRMIFRFFFFLKEMIDLYIVWCRSKEIQFFLILYNFGNVSSNTWLTKNLEYGESAYIIFYTGLRET